MDELRALSANANHFLVYLEVQEKAQTGLSSLKVGYNRVHGYYIEISKAQAAQAPAHYICRQTLKNAERFVTPQLKTFEDQVLSSKERDLAREKWLYEQLLESLNQHLQPLQACAQALAQLDVLRALAERSDTLNFCCPQLISDTRIAITAGRHPVVEQVSDQPFIANDLQFDDRQRMRVITGPNMGGKSTYMRQTALIVLLAHTGCFVPATAAEIGQIDRIFTRIGAADDLASGRSTFMVEMTETAHILQNATRNSLVLMDEIGRGTSTFDGLALAWSCAEALAETQAYTLFATHYFELTQLATDWTEIENLHLTAVEHQESIVFLHEVKPGPASQSYGIQVAQLAGIPQPVINQAKKRLVDLEQKANQNAHPQQLQADLFNTAEPAKPSEIERQIQALDLTHITPLQALNVLYAYQQQLTQGA